MDWDAMGVGRYRVWYDKKKKYFAILDMWHETIKNIPESELDRDIPDDSPALKIYVCNVMTQHGETDDYRASDHLKALIKHTHAKIVDYCIVNSQVPNEDMLARYRQEKAFPTVADSSVIRRMGYKVLAGNIINTADFVRHNPRKLARVIINAFRREVFRKEI